MTGINQSFQDTYDVRAVATKSLGNKGVVNALDLAVIQAGIIAIQWLFPTIVT
ncbi:MAG: hypothetical protein ACXAEU_22375 [Candidatus Hodarchaeales archaeon]|jgi:hypothetical protein